MSACADAIERRFGDGGPSGEGAADNEFIRRVLSRKTVRRYSDVIPGDSLLDLLVAAALSASAKSDFQQASILRVSDPLQRAAIGRTVSEHAVDRPVAGVLRISRRCQTAAAHRRIAWKAGSQRNAGRLLQRQRRCGTRDADHDPVRRIRRARRLSHQRHSQRDRQGRRDSWFARSGLSGRRTLPRLSAGRGLRQLAPAAPRNDTPRSLR